jgi:hypothetical protein
MVKRLLFDREFNEQGYVVLRNVIPPAVVAAARR